MLSKEMVRLDLPHILTALPGPRATELIERDSRGPVAVLHALLSAGCRARRRRDHRRCRRQPLPRFQCRASPWLHRPLPSAKWWRPSNSSRKRLIHMSGTDFYYENMVQLAEKLASIAPGAGRASRVFRKFRRRSHRSRHEAGALSHRPRQIHRLHRRFSWTHAGRALAHR